MSQTSHLFYLTAICYFFLLVAPNIWIKYQLIGAYDGQRVILECHSQAYPKSINYWTKDTGEIIPHGNV